MSKRQIYIGFDSAWSINNYGAYASAIIENGVCRFDGPNIASFDDVLRHIKDVYSDGSYLLIAIDQPLIVKNEGGKRPVEKAVSHLVGSYGGGVQPANRGRSDLFGDGAPIWDFLKHLGGDIEPLHSLESSEGIFGIEVFPAIGNLGLFKTFYSRGQMPKYNPTRKTFTLSDWKLLCGEVGMLFKEMEVPEWEKWCSDRSNSVSVSKADQDKLDALICAQHALHWTKYGLKGSVVVGDTTSGYMVIPASPAMAMRLVRDAKGDDVSVLYES